jgi:hypothetical protein
VPGSVTPVSIRRGLLAYYGSTIASRDAHRRPNPGLMS